LIVSAGACGHGTEITAEKEKAKTVRVVVETECEMVSKMAEDLGPLDMMAVFTGFPDNPVYRAAARHLKHVSCPVPSAILKTVEVELGLAVPKDVHMEFARNGERSGR